MVIPYQFAYLFWALFFGAIWAIFYALKPSVRREMLVLSVLMGILGPFAEYFATHNYYHPYTLFGTRIGFEDFLIGFFYGGVAAALYEIIHLNRPNTTSRAGSVPGAVFALILTFTAMYAGAFVFPEMTIYGLLGVMFLIGTTIIVYRPNLVKHAFITGAGMVGLTFVFFQIFITLFPGIVEAWWELDRLSGVIVAGIPFEELLFAFLWGYVLGPASEVVTRIRAKDVLKF